MRVRTIEEIAELVNEKGEPCDCDDTKAAIAYLADKDEAFLRGLIVAAGMAIDMVNHLPNLIQSLIHQDGHCIASYQRQALVKLGLVSDEPKAIIAEPEIVFPTHIL